MKRGRFISLEGGEGVGKSTQARLLAEALRARGLSVILTREPGGTPGAEAIRTLLLDPAQRWPLSAEALLFAAARSDHVAHVILPALAAGQWVVCDRFIDSSRAYQGGGCGLPDADLMALHQTGSNGLLPDLTVLLTAPPQTIADRLAKRDGGVSDRIGGRDPSYHQNVAQSFARFAADEPDRFISVCAEGTPDEVHRHILASLAPLLDSAE